MSPEVSIVIPLYNEQENVEPLLGALATAAREWTFTWEAILVDDGSTDETLERLERGAASDPRIRPVRLVRNAGQTLAMAAGFAHARGSIVVSMDGDLQNDPRDVAKLVARVDDGFDVVCGWRRNRQDAFLSRTLPSRIANRMIAGLTGVPIHDNGCSLKAYRANVIRSLELYSDMHRFLPALSAMTGARIDEVEVRHHPRTRGQSKYGIGRTFKVLADMITIKMITQFSSRPGRWFTMISLPWLALAAATAIAWLASIWFFEAPNSIVLPSLALVSFYLFGSLLSLSVISEMFLAHRDRAYLRRLVEALTVEVTGTVPPASGVGERP